MMSGSLLEYDKGSAATERAQMEGLCFAELIERARRGDPEAARWLVENYEGAIRREIRFAILDSRLRRVIDESDVLQSVLGRFFLNLYAGQYGFDHPEQLARLLKDMVRAKVVDRARYWTAACRDHRRQARTSDSLDGPSREPTPSRIVEEAELLVEFEKRLSAEEHAILGLRRQGLRWPEVAGAIGNGDPEAIRKRFERALARISRELGLEE
jgi:hypothetical protein